MLRWVICSLLNQSSSAPRALWLLLELKLEVICQVITRVKVSHIGCRSAAPESQLTNARLSHPGAYKLYLRN